MSDDQPDRTLEYALELAVAPKEVWDAIATPEGLKSWFAYDARVTPGAGGSIWLSWGDFDGEVPITIWDPPRHIRQSEHRPPYGDPSLPPVDITVDYFIEAREGGGTLLRLVHAGMGPEPGWDGEYHATAEDWPWFLANLAHYLAEHAGTVREVISLTVPFGIPAADLWPRLLGGAAEVDRIREGDPYELALFGCESVGGMVKLLTPGRRFMGTIDGLNRAMLVLTVHDKGESSKLALELSTYGLDEKQLANIRRTWSEALRDLGGELTKEMIDA